MNNSGIDVSVFKHRRKVILVLVLIALASFAFQEPLLDKAEKFISITEAAD